MIQTSAPINPGNSGGALIGQGKVTNSRRAFLGVEVAATTSDGLLITRSSGAARPPRPGSAPASW